MSRKSWFHKRILYFVTCCTGINSSPSVASIAVRISDSNDNPPVFERNLYTFVTNRNGKLVYVGNWKAILCKIVSFGV